MEAKDGRQEGEDSTEEKGEDNMEYKGGKQLREGEGEFGESTPAPKIRFPAVEREKTCYRLESLECLCKPEKDKEEPPEAEQVVEAGNSENKEERERIQIEEYHNQLLHD